MKCFSQKRASADLEDSVKTACAAPQVGLSSMENGDQRPKYKDMLCQECPNRKVGLSKHLREEYRKQWRAIPT